MKRTHMKMLNIEREQIGDELHIGFDLFYERQNVVVIKRDKRIEFRIRDIKPGDKIGLVEFIVLEKTLKRYKRNKERYNLLSTYKK